jgi:acetylornithine/N-succinyldiaminopimelate aminotransferase
LLILTAGDQILRFVPPLIIGEAEVDEALSILDQALAEQPR